MVETKKRQGGEWETADETDMIRTEPEQKSKAMFALQGKSKHERNHTFKMSTSFLTPVCPAHVLNN